MFKEKLKSLRVSENLSQKELSLALETTCDNIYSWEKGRARPSYEMLCKIATFFNVPIDYLLGLTDEFGNKV